jgi:hypothetical protein|nr:MAG TPA: hypothetical protein [Caudoviricetes sp.]
MGEIDVTEVTAIEYLEKLIKIDNERSCDWSGCDGCEYSTTSCVDPDEIANIGIEKHIKNVMTFELHEVDWNEVEKDTLIEVKDFETDDWIKRYFSHSNDGRVFAYLDGRTSKTETIVSSWDCARLVEDDNE